MELPDSVIKTVRHLAAERCKQLPLDAEDLAQEGLIKIIAVSKKKLLTKQAMITVARRAIIDVVRSHRGKYGTRPDQISFSSLDSVSLGELESAEKRQAGHVSMDGLAYVLLKEEAMKRNWIKDMRDSLCRIL